MKKLHQFSTLALASLIFFSGCSVRVADIFEEQDSAPDRHVDLSKIPDAKPRVEPRSRYGNPSSYEVLGKRYRVMPSADGHTERGVASWYGNKFHGRRTSSGEPYDMFSMTAAHKHLPLPTYVEVTNLENGRKIIVKVNDRGPFHQNRIIDLSYVAAAKLGITAKGTGLVEIKAINPARPGQPKADAQPVVSRNSQPQPAVQPVLTGSKEIKPASQPGLFVQAGAFKDRSNALRMKSRLESTLDNPIRITELTTSDDIIYRVQVGPLPQVQLADTVSLQLENMGIKNLRTVIE